MTTKEQIALGRYNSGEKYSVSTFIDEDTIILGYGDLNIDFEFPLPAFITVKEYGTQSWKQWFENKGLYQYRMVNRKDKVEGLSHYMNDEEFEKYKELNPNFEFIKL